MITPFFYLTCMLYTWLSPVEKLLHMKKMLPLWLLTVSLLFAASIKAQLYKIELDKKTNQSTLIAEGKVIAQKSFWNDAHTMIFTSNTVEVYKTFKGQTTTSTIEVMTQGGSVGTQAVDVSELLSLHKGQTGIFFCYENTAGLKSPSRQTLYDVYSSDQGFLRYNYATNTATAPFATYSDIENNLYSLIEKQTGITKTVVNASFSVGKLLKMQASSSSNGVQTTLAPTISFFVPTTVNGGALNDPANNVLTINGSGFGNTPGGSAAILFKDGNNDNTAPDYSVPYNSPYVVSWKDNAIVIKVPGRAATGKIAVVLNDGATQATSATSLTVFFSILNFQFDFSSVGVDTVIVGEPRLMNTNSQGGYTYKFGADTAGKSINFATDAAAATFNRAVTTWKDLVGANLVAGGTTTVQKVGNDNINVVEYDNLNTGVPAMAEGVLEVTYSFGTICYQPTPFTLFNAQKSGFDILIRNPNVSTGGVVNFETGPCFPVVTTYDLENIILHEVGHALNLMHINDGYQVTNNAYAHVNPGKIMHYSIIDYANRRSPDESAYQGALYSVEPQEIQFGDCAYPGQMSQLSRLNIANDECPSTFPIIATPANTVVAFDLAHATSNKDKDPAFTQVNGQGTGEFVTNNAYYAFKTSALNNGTLTLKITNYKTSPADIASCTGQGVRMAMYVTTSCPVGQGFPAPIAVNTFTGNGLLTNITGLQASTTYLLYFDGLRNTKASFNVTLAGSALPIVLSNFTGEYIHGDNNLFIDIVQAVNVKSIDIEKSGDGNNFNLLGALPFTQADLIGKHTYIDPQPFAGKNYYRLKITDEDGAMQYSNIIVLQNSLNKATYIYPNPAKGQAYISFSGQQAGRYNVELYSTDGKKLSTNPYTLSNSNQTVSVPLGNVATGIYMVKVVDSKGKTILEQKLLKQ